jgi:hypothetical protein
MGLFSRSAAKSELNTIALLQQSISEYSWLAQGRLTLPCHLAQEPHTGIWVGTKKGANRFLGVFRCQGHFWGVELSRGQVLRAQQGQDQSMGILTQRLQGERPADLGPMSQGTDALALSVSGVNFVGD